MIVIGMDVGTTRSKVAAMDETGRPQIVLNRRGDPFTPSVIYFEDGRTPIVGAEALAEGFLHPEYVHSCFKRALGSPDGLHTDASGKSYTATGFTQILITDLKQDVEARFNEEVDEAVFTVPANFQDHKKQAMIDAAGAAGIKVVKLVHEPTAAGIAYALQKKRDFRFVVFDLGGGTLDVSILEAAGSEITVLSTTGREKLGGEDFNARIERLVVEQFAKETGYEPTVESDAMFFQELADKAERAKIHLSQKTATKIVAGCQGRQAIVEITRDQFESLTSDLLQDALGCTTQAVEEASLSWTDLDSIILVGGSVRMPAVQSALADLSSIVPHCDIEPDRAVCYGAAQMCAMEFAKQGKAIMIGGRAIPTPQAFVQEVTAYGVGCCVADKDGALRNAVILSKGTSIPTTKTDRFSLLHEDQTEARIEILQGGEGQAYDECLSIGEIVLTNLPVEHKKSKRIEVTYAIDANGMIRATGKDLVGGEQVEIRIDYSKGTTSSKPGRDAA